MEEILSSNLASFGRSNNYQTFKKTEVSLQVLLTKAIQA